MLDWTGIFERSLDGENFGMVFVELHTWLMRIRFFSSKSSRRLVEGIGWLRRFVRRTTMPDLPELHGDSDMSWTVRRRDTTLTLSRSRPTQILSSRPSTPCGARLGH